MQNQARKYLMTLMLLAFSLWPYTLARAENVHTQVVDSVSMHSSAPSLDDQKPSAYTVVEVNLQRQRLRLFWRDEKSNPFGSFERLAQWLNQNGEHLEFAMNAGMFHFDFSPVGLLQIDGAVLAPLNLDAGYGNFFLQPNGVFAWSEQHAAVLESNEYRAQAARYQNATQSGPLMLRRGQIHPSFDPQSHSKHIRNAVGISGQRIFFVISQQAVSFYEFALYLRDELKCSDALYLDGSISSLYSIELNRHDKKTKLGPILGVVARTPN